MNRYIFILLCLITTHSLASNQTELIKIKAKQINNIVKTKILIKGDFINPYRAKLKTGNEENAYFIRHVTAQVDGDIVYDISLSPQFRQRNAFVLMFDFDYIGRSDTLQVIVTDNKGKQTSLSAKIKNTNKGKSHTLNSKKSTLKEKDYWIIKPKLWKITNTEEAIKELYGTKKPKVGDLNISLAGYTNFWYFAPIKISSKVRMKSIAIFSDDLTNPSYREKIPSIRAIISIPEGTSIVYSKSFNVLTSGTCCKDSHVPITVVGIDKDDNLHKVVFNAELACSADCEM